MHNIKWICFDKQKKYIYQTSSVEITYQKGFLNEKLKSQSN